MSWNDIWKLVCGYIAGLGGLGVVITAIIKFSCDLIAQRLAEKYTLTMNKELERYKTGLESKTYISKAKFDVEFRLYRELSSAFFEMVKDITHMIPAGYAQYPADKEDRRKYEDKLYDTARKSTVSAQGLLNSNCPFISADLWEKYEEILGLCRIQLGVYEDRWNVLTLETPEERESFALEDYQRSREIKDKWGNLCSEVREYVSKLDIIE